MRGDDGGERGGGGVGGQMDTSQNSKIVRSKQPCTSRIVDGCMTIQDIFTQLIKQLRIY